VNQICEDGVDSDLEQNEPFFLDTRAHDPTIKRDEIHGDVRRSDNGQDRSFDAFQQPASENFVVEMESIVEVFDALLSIPISLFPNFVEDSEQAG